MNNPNTPTSRQPAVSTPSTESATGYLRYGNVIYIVQERGYPRDLAAQMAAAHLEDSVQRGLIRYDPYGVHSHIPDCTLSPRERMRAIQMLNMIREDYARQYSRTQSQGIDATITPHNLPYAHTGFSRARLNSQAQNHTGAAGLGRQGAREPSTSQTASGSPDQAHSFADQLLQDPKLGFRLAAQQRDDTDRAHAAMGLPGHNRDFGDADDRFNDFGDFDEEYYDGDPRRGPRRFGRY
jgi:hypothetical protein